MRILAAAAQRIDVEVRRLEILDIGAFDDLQFDLRGRTPICLTISMKRGAKFGSRKRPADRLMPMERPGQRSASRRRARQSTSPAPRPDRSLRHRQVRRLYSSGDPSAEPRAGGPLPPPRPGRRRSSAAGSAVSNGRETYPAKRNPCFVIVSRPRPGPPSGRQHPPPPPAARDARAP